MAVQEPTIQNSWTYGEKIMDNTYVTIYGQQLCSLVASCLAVKPIDRPTLQQLRTDLDNLRPAAVSQEEREWLTRFLRQPSQPPIKPVARAFG